MESFTLTRKDMAAFLSALGGQGHPIEVLQQAWGRQHQTEMEAGKALPAFLATSLPPVLEKWLKGSGFKGFSLQEIAALGQLIEYSHMPITSMQNWVKRDFKEFFASPKLGKKYSLNQAALLFIIDDLKSNLDFVSIRRLFEIVFMQPEHDEDDLIEPLELYALYSGMFEELDANNDQLLDTAGHETGSRNQDALAEAMLRTKAETLAGRLTGLSAKQREAVRNVLLIAAVSIQTTYFQALSRRYFHATVFLG
ncbi:hypothetical protein J31TS4_04360 [Paenibacillus sp. J31TS4]|uniref:DUF1836 domain-containing protein n=1 Tax=Paenibacillus sp. J31TS4 TaxID=2807195 RepID=UPI001B230619|nr:DUF1836 domain-containing protein [Paenibacillus sp. J31TS4]GIP37156.1 hypothetical protein J31TS4_04360 [Paenibacillus sp. J31TS4]